MTKLGRPKQYGEARDTADILKKSALDLLFRKSFSAITIKDIGREANLTSAMIYYHFRDKDDLLCASIEFAIDQAISQFQTYTEDVTHPAATIHEWLSMHVAFHSEISKVLKLIIDYNRSQTRVDRIDQAIKHFYDTERSVLLTCISEGVEKGVFQTDNPENIRRLISTFLDGAVMRAQIRQEYDIETAVEEFETILWGVLGFHGY